MQVISNNPQKCSFVALLGAPNAGKSTLVNRLVGSKVSIVTPKVQTTRTSLRGICMHGQTQLVLIDTPGIFNPKKTLEKAIVQEAWRNISEADELLVLVDAKKGLCSDTRTIVEALKQQNKRAILVLNKVDTILPGRLLPLTQQLNDYGVFNHTFMVSALNGDGVQDLKNHLAEHASEGPWMFPDDQICDAPARLMAAEITREHLFMKLQQELPYSIAVETEKFEEHDNGEITIHQAVYVLTEGHKAIVLGRGGAQIKDIGAAARKQMARLFEAKVHLFLFVKVKEGWTEKPSMYRDVGLEFPS